MMINVAYVNNRSSKVAVAIARKREVISHPKIVVFFSRSNFE